MSLSTYITGIIQATRFSDAILSFLVGASLGMVFALAYWAGKDIPFVAVPIVGIVCGMALYAYGYANNYWRES